MNTFKINPYHKFRANEAKSMSPIAGKLISLLDKSNPSLLFHEVVDAIDAIQENKTHERTIAVLQMLFGRCLEASGSNLAALEIYLLLRMLIANDDHENVYGFKCVKLIRLLSQVLKKIGRSDASVRLEQWVNDPTPQYSEANGRKAIICAPEIVIAQLMSLNDKPTQHARASIQHIGIACKQLTDAYLTQSTETLGSDTFQIQVFRELSNMLSFKEWLLFAKIILKKISVGVGPMAVLECIPHMDAKNMYVKQHDLAQLAEKSILHMNDPTILWQKQPTQLVCGIPYVPMTCENLKSPYLFKWIFSKEEILNKPISPRDGRLVIVQASSKWYIPLSHNAKQKTYVSIDEESILKNKSRKQHVLLLREFRSQQLINEERCHGLVIHYTLSKEKNQSIMMLIRTISNALSQGIKLFDDTVLETDENEETPAAHMDLSKEENIEMLVKQIPSSAGVETDAGGLKLSVVPAFVSKQKNNARIKTTLKAMDTIPPPRIPLLKRKNNRRIEKVAPAIAQDVKLEHEDEEKVIVQLKYDGDRIQIHINSATPPSVFIFTKSGKDVSELYSNIRDELQRIPLIIPYTPCIFDGELIVVDSNGDALPWSSEKWRYNIQESESVPIDKIDIDPNTIITIVNDASHDIKLEDDNYAMSTINNDEEEFVTFASIHNLKQWSGMGPTAKKSIKCRPLKLKTAKLQYIIFDILMHQGKEICEQSYSKRFGILQSYYLPIFQRHSQYVKVIPDSRPVNTTHELIQLLHSTIVNGEEGLILKNPSSEYVFGKSKKIQKLKISGPDINCLIVGAGFSLSTNPHRWGLLSCIQSSESDESISTNKPIFLNYCRTEVLEGEDIWKGLEYVLSMKSKIKTSDVKRVMRTGKTALIPNEYYNVKVSVKLMAKDIDEFIFIEFNAKSSTLSQYDCTIIIQKKLLLDVQWIINPLECHIGLSMRGDLRPLKYSMAISQEEMLCPRHPIGRLELANFHKSPCDTLYDIRVKFENMLDVRNTLEEHFINTINRLRRKYPKDDRHLQLMRRILLGFKHMSGDMQRNVRWPQTLPSTSFSLDEFSTLINEFSQKSIFQPSALISTDHQKRAFQPLSTEEKGALVKLGNKTLWDELDKVAKPIFQSENQTVENANKISEIQHLMSRLDQLKGIQIPVVCTCTGEHHDTNVYTTLFPGVVCSDDESEEDLP